MDETNEAEELPSNEDPSSPEQPTPGRLTRAKEAFALNPDLIRSRQELADAKEAVARAVREAGGKVAEAARNPVRTFANASEASYQSRIRIEEANRKGWFPRHRKSLQRVIVGTALEYGTSAPTLGAYGLGDGLALLSSILGVELYTGDNIDKIDRIIYFLG
ncbi:MAG: hypothetical protein ACMG6E_00400, partial [Candidatus Roizmanbacteria bacterium]